MSGCNRNSTATPRADADINTEVQSRLFADANLPNKQMTVATSNGVVTLTGTVSSDAERMTAGNDAGSVNGVKTVINNLQVSSALNEPMPNPSAPAPVAVPRARNTVAHVRPTSVAATNSVIPDPTASRPAPAALPPAVVMVTVPSGTSFSIRTNDTIDSGDRTGRRPVFRRDR